MNRNSRITIKVWMTLWLCCLMAGLVTAEDWKFEDAKVGELPKGWTAAKTGEGAGSVWKVLDDASAPAGSKVLAQTSSSPFAAVGDVRRRMYGVQFHPEVVHTPRGEDILASFLFDCKL